MQITDAQLQCFIDLYAKEFGVRLSETAAQQKALSLLRFLAISVTPIDNKSEDSNLDIVDTNALRSDV